jgi:glycosyltransferase involved in cell wall biosynthesis
MSTKQHGSLHEGKRIPKVVFLFPSFRNENLFNVQTRQDADTSLRGLNHIAGAEHLTAFPKSVWSALLIPRLLRYDFAIAQDNFLLGYIVSICARLLRLKTRWIYVAIHSSVLMRRHSNHPIRLFLLKKFWGSYSRIICLSSEQLEDFVRLGIPREHLVFVPFGVDAQFFQPIDSSHEKDLIVSVGRDTGRDYTTLFTAAELTDHDFLVITAHKNIPPDMSVPANVSVLYNQSLSEVREAYKRARLVVLVSKGDQTLEGSDCSGQTAILDALAAEKAVIATYRSWINDYFVPDQDLIIVPPNDPVALVRAIDSLWHDDERRKHIAESGHNKVVARYTTKAFAKELCTLMDSIREKNVNITRLSKTASS